MLCGLENKSIRFAFPKSFYSRRISAMCLSSIKDKCTCSRYRRGIKKKRRNPSRTPATPAKGRSNNINSITIIIRLESVELQKLVLIVRRLCGHRRSSRRRRGRRVKIGIRGGGLRGGGIRGGGIRGGSDSYI